MSNNVHLVGLQPDGSRVWFCREDERIVDFKIAYVPRFDDDPCASKAVTIEFAREVKTRWKDQFGCIVHIALDPTGRFVEEDVLTAASTGRDGRVPIKASLDGTNFYLVIPTRTPKDGECWCLRFDDRPELAAQAIIGPGPIAVLQRAKDRELLQFIDPLPPEPVPQAPVPQMRSTLASIRPGDR